MTRETDVHPALSGLSVWTNFMQTVRLSISVMAGTDFVKSTVKLQAAAPSVPPLSASLCPEKCILFGLPQACRIAFVFFIQPIPA